MLVAFHEYVHSHATSIDRANETSVEMERFFRVWALVLARPRPPYIAAARKTKSPPPSLFQAPPFPFAPGVSCLFYMVRLCLCVLFKVCKRRCLDKEKKMMAAMQLYAFPCDATRVHRGALSLDTKRAPFSPSLTTSCNVIYKPSSSRACFFFIHHSLIHVVQRTKGLLVYDFAVERLFLYFNREERVFSRSAVVFLSFFFNSFATINLPVARVVTARQFFFLFFSLSHVYVCVCVCAHVIIVNCQWLIPVRCTLTLPLSPRPQPTSARMHALFFFLLFRL